MAKNEAVFRAVNREIEQADLEAGGGGDQEIEVLCECGRKGCSGVINLTVAEYDRVHSQKDRFVVLRGHESREMERVVEERAEYSVVDKFGEAEEIAEEAPS
jgi:diaminopimelate decarboxylase